MEWVQPRFHTLLDGLHILGNLLRFSDILGLVAQGIPLLTDTLKLGGDLPADLAHAVIVGDAVGVVQTCLGNTVVGRILPTAR